ncbi:protein LEG1 homolog [Hemicordylus capensis]|uniref:protein LEG1 homolog n=1 Tax=Hemicordylus capensis TaxID=884348 RepID=UPI00230467FB|nr:protein LEG1 homolog [Hemicordylus capensis]
MGYLFQSLCHLIPFLLVTTTLNPPPPEKPGDYQDTFPPLWHSAPGNLEDYPIKDNKIIINAWNYRERLGAYKILLDSSAEYFATLAPNNAGNILWGLPLQHGWQYSTGRLADPLNITTCGHENGDRLCISTHSWWASMNYYLAIIPFLGALETGLYGELPYEVEVLPPEEQSADFCHSVVECNTQAPAVMASWRDFFKYLLSTTMEPERSAAQPFSKDEALKHMWHAHVLTLAYALPKFQNRLPYLSRPESSFGKDWSTAVDFLAAAHFSTDQNTINHFQTGLSPRMLFVGDKAPFIEDFTPTQNKVLFLLGALRKTNELTGNILLLLWNKAMSTEEGRKIGRQLIESVF